MKLLFQTLNRNEVDAARFLLESRGIPVFVSNENSGTLMGPVFAAKHFGVWAVLEEQHDDAEKLLDNADHEVKEPVDVELFYQDFAKQSPAALNKILLWGVGLVLLCFFLLYLLS